VVIPADWSGTGCVMSGDWSGSGRRTGGGLCREGTGRRTAGGRSEETGSGRRTGQFNGERWRCWEWSAACWATGRRTVGLNTSGTTGRNYWSVVGW
jgi:hypothetical protein